MKNTSVFLVIFSINACLSAQLPASFKKCDRKQSDFNDCLTQAISDAVHQLKEPKPEVGLPSLEPLFVPKVVIGAGTSAVNFNQDFQNMKVSGLTAHNTMKVNMDFDKKMLHIDVTYDELRFDFDYLIDGKILMMPIKGKGTGYIVASKPSATVSFQLEEGKKHYKAVNSKVVYNKIEGLVVHFDNLFDGDKTLGDGVNNVINENWEAVLDDVKPGYEAVSAKTVESIFNGLLAKISISELW